MNKRIIEKSESSKERPSVVPYKNWRLILYIAGKTPHCMLTLTNLKNFCDLYLPAQYTIEIIDLQIYPERAQSDDIIAIPTIVKLLPTPKRYIIGDFSNHELMLMKLGLNASTNM